MTAISAIQSPSIKPQNVEGSDVKIISALVVTIVASLFGFLIPMNGITLCSLLVSHSE